VEGAACSEVCARGVMEVVSVALVKMPKQRSESVSTAVSRLVSDFFPESPVRIVLIGDGPSKSGDWNCSSWVRNFSVNVTPRPSPVWTVSMNFIGRIGHGPSNSSTVSAVSTVERLTCARTLPVRNTYVLSSIRLSSSALRFSSRARAWTSSRRMNFCPWRGATWVWK